MSLTVVREHPNELAHAPAMVEGSALPGKCTVITGDERGFIAEFLDVDVGAEEKVVARLACAGGNNVARFKASYSGLSTCQAASRKK